MATKKAVLLYSSYGGNLAQEKHTNKVNDWCDVRCRGGAHEQGRESRRN